MNGVITSLRASELTRTDSRNHKASQQAFGVTEAITEALRKGTGKMMHMVPHMNTLSIWVWVQL